MGTELWHGKPNFELDELGGEGGEFVLVGDGEVVFGGLRFVVGGDWANRVGGC